MTDVRYPDMVINGVPVVATPAEIDITSADALGSALLKAAAAGPGPLVVDMTQTQFCDSSGLHTLFAAHKRARAEGREVLLGGRVAGEVYGSRERAEAGSSDVIVPSSLSTPAVLVVTAGRGESIARRMIVSTRTRDLPASRGRWAWRTPGSPGPSGTLEPTTRCAATSLRSWTHRHQIRPVITAGAEAMDKIFANER